MKNLNTVLGAVTRNDVTLLKQLLNAGLPADENGPRETTPLTIAARNGQDEAVEALLTAGADPDKAGFGGVTALMAASAGRHINIIRGLLSAGASVDLRDSIGATALIHAARQGDAAAVELLLAAGADSTIEDDEHQTALMWARRRGGWGREIRVGKFSFSFATRSASKHTDPVLLLLLRPHTDRVTPVKIRRT